MTHHAIARLAITVLAGAASVACNEAVVAPDTADGMESPTALARPQQAPGQYDIEFRWSGELAVIAHVRDAEGAAPTGGSVTFQYCSLKGLPPGDITQPDEAPASACADGSGRWRNLLRANLDDSGDVGMGFGVVSVVTVIGFRITYSPQGSNVAAGSAIADWYRPL